MTARPQERRSLVRGVAIVLLAMQVGCPGVGNEADRSGATGETLGFVVSGWGFQPPAGKPWKRCPDGPNQTEVEHYGIDLLQFRADMKAEGYSAAVEKHFPADACPDPARHLDPGFLTVEVEVPIDGLDLDGTDSTESAGGACAHDDFTSPDGTTGIDNQFWRLMGCTMVPRAFGGIDRLNKRYYPFGTDPYPILVEITGVDDRRHDDEVQVRFFSSADTVTLDANGEAVEYMSMRVHEDDRYSSPTARGRIEKGILTTEPVDLELRFTHGFVDDELRFRDARLQVELNDDGKLEGMLGYYWDAQNLYRIHNDHSIDGQHTGRLAALARGYMCAGMYHALRRIADGHPDPETRRCTSVSTAAHLEAIPAFVIKRDG